mgnify:CR=1 FL=1
MSKMRTKLYYSKGQATPYNRDKTAKGFLAGSGEVEAVREHRATQAKQK